MFRFFLITKKQVIFSRSRISKFEILRKVNNLGFKNSRRKKWGSKFCGSQLYTKYFQSRTISLLVTEGLSGGSFLRGSIVRFLLITNYMHKNARNRSKPSVFSHPSSSIYTFFRRDTREKAVKDYHRVEFFFLSDRVVRLFKLG